MQLGNKIWGTEFLLFKLIIYLTKSKVWETASLYSY